MKPRKDLRPLTDIRVTRKSNIELAHGDSHGWAVSYADLLMVLLSFFVLYFSFAENNDNGPVDEQMQELALAMKGMSGAQIKERMRKPDSVSMVSLAEHLTMEGIKVSKIDDHLLVELGDASYRSGDYQMTKGLREQVDLVFSKLDPIKEKFHLMVIGHADKRPMTRKNEFLQDNFDLSSVRALRVLKYMIGKGYPENQASARAASSFDRDARSITFEIRVAQAKKKGEAL